MSGSSFRVHVCHGPNCTPRGGAAALLSALEDEVRLLGLANDVEILATSCRSRCELGPSVNVYPGPTCYGHVTPEAIRTIAVEHLKNGRPVTELIVRESPAKTFDLNKLDKLFGGKDEVRD